MGNAASLADYLEDSANDTTSSRWYESSLDQSSAAPLGASVLEEDDDSGHPPSEASSASSSQYFDADDGLLRDALSKRGLARASASPTAWQPKPQPAMNSNSPTTTSMNAAMSTVTPSPPRKAPVLAAANTPSSCNNNYSHDEGSPLDAHININNKNINNSVKSNSPSMKNDNYNNTEDLILPPSKAIAKAMMLEDVRARVAGETPLAAAYHVHNSKTTAAVTPPSPPPYKATTSAHMSWNIPNEPETSCLLGTESPDISPIRRVMVEDDVHLTKSVPSPPTLPSSFPQRQILQGQAVSHCYPVSDNKGPEQSPNRPRRRPRKPDYPLPSDQGPERSPDRNDNFLSRAQAVAHVEKPAQSTARSPRRRAQYQADIYPTPDDDKGPERSPARHEPPAPNAQPTQSILKKQSSFDRPALVIQSQPEQPVDADNEESAWRGADQETGLAMSHKTSRAAAHATNNDSSSQNYRSRSPASACQKTQSWSRWLCYACFLCILLALVTGGLLYFFWWADNDSDNDDADQAVNVPTTSPSTAVPTVAMTEDWSDEQATDFPTTGVVLWEDVGDAIALDSATVDDVPALAMTFDGRILAFVNDKNLHTYQWSDASNAWTPRGSPVPVTTPPGPTIPWRTAGMAMNTAGNVLAWADPVAQSVHVLEWQQNDWQEQAEISIAAVGNVVPSTEPYALALSADGDVLAVGDPSALNAAGRAYVFQRGNQQNGWSLVRTWMGSIGSQTGWAIALSLDGKTLALGAIDNALSVIAPGMVRVYRQEDEGSWNQLGQTLVGLRDRDRFGASVALSASGQQLAVGAPGYEPTGKNEPDGGVAQVFQLEHSTQVWKHQGETLPSTTGNEGFGNVVSLSADAEMVAVVGTAGEMRIHRINSSDRWIRWGLTSTPSSPSSIASVALAGNGRVVAVVDQANYNLRVYRAVSW